MSAPLEYVENKILYFAFLSRTAVILLQIISNALIPDLHPDVFNPPPPQYEVHNGLDKIVLFVLSGFRRWDAVYFLHITEHGYIYENSSVFFPLFPMLVRLLANTVLFPLQYIMTLSNVYLLTAILLNNYLFLKTSVLLFRLGIKMTVNESIAYKAALLFCVNPASVFMSAPYSEIMAVYLTLYGMLKIEMDHMFEGSFLFGLSSAARSNGIVNIGYLFYKLLINIPSRICDLKTAGISLAFVRSTFGGYIFPSVLQILLSVIPFVFYQYFTFFNFCGKREVYNIPKHLLDYGEIRNYKIVGEGPVSPWCNTSLPMAYSYVQKNHWGLGLFAYYEYKQIPNFILALPVTILGVAAVVTYYTNNRTTVLMLGLGADHSKKKKTDGDVKGYSFESAAMLPYIVHMTFLLLFGWTFMHIQVITRLLFSSAPVLYWFSAYISTENVTFSKPVDKRDVRSPSNQPIETKKNLKNKFSNLFIDQLKNFSSQNKYTKLVFIYFLGYFVVGTIAFSNFLPWT